MLMPDVNILVYAHRTDEQTHAAYRAWFERLVRDPQPFALSVLVAVGFLRIITNTKIYKNATPTAIAVAAIEQIIAQPNCRLITPGPAHWTHVADLCRQTAVKGKLVADAQHAALAMAEGCTWVTRDSDFGRFAEHGLKWEHLVLG